MWPIIHRFLVYLVHRFVYNFLLHHSNDTNCEYQNSTRYGADLLIGRIWLRCGSSVPARSLWFIALAFGIHHSQFSHRSIVALEIHLYNRMGTASIRNLARSHYCFKNTRVQASSATPLCIPFLDSWLGTGTQRSSWRI